MAKKKKRFLKWLFYSIRIVGMDQFSFQERWRFKINRMQFLSIILLMFFLIFILSYILFSYTVVGTLLPENVSDKSRDNILEAHASVEDMNKKIEQQEKFIKNLQQVILGEVELEDVFNIEDVELPESKDDFLIDTSRTEEELELQQKVRERDRTNIQSRKDILNELFLLDPVSGSISQNYHPTKHPAVDIVTNKDESILSCMDGVVIYTGYDDLDGWIVIVKHPNEITSVYKHCSKVLKESGDRVSAGDPIAIVGDSGSRSTGPHLHFELWSDTGTLNPTDYLSFGR